MERPQKKISKLPKRKPGIPHPSKIQNQNPNQKLSTTSSKFEISCENPDLAPKTCSISPDLRAGGYSPEKSCIPRKKVNNNNNNPNPNQFATRIPSFSHSNPSSNSHPNQTTKNNNNNGSSLEFTTDPPQLQVQQLSDSKAREQKATSRIRSIPKPTSKSAAVPSNFTYSNSYSKSINLNKQERNSPSPSSSRQIPVKLQGQKQSLLPYKINPIENPNQKKGRAVSVPPLTLDQIPTSTQVQKPPEDHIENEASSFIPQFSQLSSSIPQSPITTPIGKPPSRLPKFSDRRAIKARRKLTNLKGEKLDEIENHQDSEPGITEVEDEAGIEQETISVKDWEIETPDENLDLDLDIEKDEAQSFATVSQDQIDKIENVINADADVDIDGWTLLDTPVPYSNFPKNNNNNNNSSIPMVKSPIQDTGLLHDLFEFIENSSLTKSLFSSSKNTDDDKKDEISTGFEILGQDSKTQNIIVGVCKDEYKNEEPEMIAEIPEILEIPEKETIEPKFPSSSSVPVKSSSLILETVVEPKLELEMQPEPDSVTLENIENSVPEEKKETVKTLCSNDDDDDDEKEMEETLKIPSTTVQFFKNASRIFISSKSLIKFDEESNPVNLENEEPTKESPSSVIVEARNSSSKKSSTTVKINAIQNEQKISPVTIKKVEKKISSESKDCIKTQAEQDCEKVVEKLWKKSSMQGNFSSSESEFDAEDHISIPILDQNPVMKISSKENNNKNKTILEENSNQRGQQENLVPLAKSSLLREKTITLSSIRISDVSLASQLTEVEVSKQNTNEPGEITQENELQISNSLQSQRSRTRIIKSSRTNLISETENTNNNNNESNKDFTTLQKEAEISLALALEQLEAVQVPLNHISQIFESQSQNKDLKTVSSSKVLIGKSTENSIEKSNAKMSNHENHMQNSDPHLTMAKTSQKSLNMEINTEDSEIFSKPSKTSSSKISEKKSSVENTTRKSSRMALSKSQLESQLEPNVIISSQSIKTPKSSMSIDFQPAQVLKNPGGTKPSLQNLNASETSIKNSPVEKMVEKSMENSALTKSKISYSSLSTGHGEFWSSAVEKKPSRKISSTKPSKNENENIQRHQSIPKEKLISIAENVLMYSSGFHLEGNLEIFNISAATICFRVTSNVPGRYQIIPPFGKINGNEKIIISVISARPLTFIKREMNQLKVEAAKVDDFNHNHSVETPFGQKLFWKEVDFMGESVEIKFIGRVRALNALEERHELTHDDCSSDEMEDNPKNMENFSPDSYSGEETSRHLSLDFNVQQQLKQKMENSRAQQSGFHRIWVYITLFLSLFISFSYIFQFPLLNG